MQYYLQNLDTYYSPVALAWTLGIPCKTGKLLGHYNYNERH